MTTKSAFLTELIGRGFMHQATNSDGRTARPTSSRFQLMSGLTAPQTALMLVRWIQIMMLRLLQKYGHVDCADGGRNNKGYDPSEKDEARPLLSDQDTEENKAGIRRIFEKYLTFGDGPSDAVMVDNADWLDGLAYIKFLRDFGSHFSINRMMGMESVKIRLDREQNPSF